MSKKDIVILSNGPGEITTWVYPVVKQLRTVFQDTVRISVILSPCPNSTGKEGEIVASYSDVDRVQNAEHFLPFLLLGKTKNNWDWYEHGLVLFLGGDQFFTLLIGKRLGYKTVVYAEWEARWYRFLDNFAVMNSSIIDSIPEKYRNKFTIVGDLMADVNFAPPSQNSPHPQPLSPGERGEMIGLLPGSKAAKLMQGVPLMLAIASWLKQQKPYIEFIIPIAPTINSEILAQYADAHFNPFVNTFGEISANLSKENQREFLITKEGLKVELIKDFPCNEKLSQCDICLTTVGANTAQLGALLIPMIVLLPTQQLDAMRAWDGLPGILANLPIIGTYFAKLINWLVLRKKRLFAWPNIWAKSEIVPELVGELKAEEVAKMVLNLLENPEKLAEIRNNLRRVRGESGASEKIVNIIKKFL
jgi:lipid A disaccharide synthetase